MDTPQSTTGTTTDPDVLTAGLIVLGALAGLIVLRVAFRSGLR